MALAKNNSWIFSKAEDIWLILLISFLSSIFLWPGFFNLDSSISSYVNVGLFFQFTHLMSVHFITYGNKDEFSSNKALLILLPVLTIISVFYVYKFQKEFLYILFSILGMIHFIRQQYGILMTSMRKGRKLSDFQARYHQFIFYNSCFTPVLFFISSTDFTYSWWGINYSNFLSEFSNVFLSFTLGGFISIIIFEVNQLIKYNSFNMAKILLLSHALCLWFLLPYFSNSWYIIIPALVIQHSIYSLYFCYKRYLSWPGTSQMRRILSKPKYGVFLAYLVNLVMCLLIFSFTEVDRFLIANTYNTTRELSDFTIIIGISIVWNHYWLDAVIWRKNFRKNAYSFLNN